MPQEEEVVMKDNQPTERQIEYAKSLGIYITYDMTRAELSDLISIKVDNDKPATDRHKGFADFFGVPFTKYVGKKVLYTKIAEYLAVKGRERDYSIWFVFRVYRSLVKGVDQVLIESPNHPIIIEAAEKVMEQTGFLTSLKRYYDQNFLWFGDFTAPNGDVYSGASKNTNAYKLAIAELKAYPEIQQDIENALNKPSTQKPKIQPSSYPSKIVEVEGSSNSSTSSAMASGCTGCLVLVVFVAIVIFLVWIVF